MTYGYLAVTISDFQLFLLALNVVSLLVLMYISNRILEDVIEESWQDDKRNTLHSIQLMEENRKLKKKYYSLMAKMRWIKEKGI